MPLPTTGAYLPPPFKQKNLQPHLTFGRQRYLGILSRGDLQLALRPPSRVYSTEGEQGLGNSSLQIPSQFFLERSPAVGWSVHFKWPVSNSPSSIVQSVSIRQLEAQLNCGANRSHLFANIAHFWTIFFRPLPKLLLYFTLFLQLNSIASVLWG